MTHHGQAAPGADGQGQHPQGQVVPSPGQVSGSFEEAPEDGSHWLFPVRVS